MGDLGLRLAGVGLLLQGMDLRVVGLDLGVGRDYPEADGGQAEGAGHYSEGLVEGQLGGEEEDETAGERLKEDGYEGKGQAVPGRISRRRRRENGVWG